ncbi:serine/threonine protein kinase [Pendulispora albinea]|uniref:non-specific serine/threonine protein kinase n=1 Tax=Pendulispora albinea TaxID=2741071 RepID=A0ABZ2M5I7_9BACT
MTDEQLPSSLRDGRYAIVRMLGEGGQAASLEAVDKREGKLVVLKRFRLQGAKSWKEVELAEREASVLSSLDHPRLPRYVEHFEEGGAFYLVTEKIEGESLAELRRRGVPMDEAFALQLLRDTAEVLAYLHGRTPPIVHRDIKPGNVIRRPDGSFALIDFGAVLHRLKPGGGSTVVGTFGYMAPEQFQGRAMPVSDVYAVAATALSVLTGREPEDLPHRGLGIDVERALSGLRIGGPLRRALASMLEPDPDRRAKRIFPVAAEGPKSDKKRQERGAQGKKDDWSGPWDDWKEWARIEKQAKKERWDALRKLQAWQVWEANRRRAALSRKERKREEHIRRRLEHSVQRAEWQARAWQMRSAQLEARRARGHHHGLPFPVQALFLVGLTIAQVAVTLALRLVVPVVLLLLSLLFGDALRRAARAVRASGKHAVFALARAKDATSGATRGLAAGDGGRERAREHGQGAEEPQKSPSFARARVEPAAFPEQDRVARAAFDDEEEIEARLDADKDPWTDEEQRAERRS